MNESTVTIPTATRNADGVYEVEFDSIGHAMAVAAAVGRAADYRSIKIVDRRSLQGTAWTNFVTHKNVADLLRRPPAKLVATVAEMKRRVEDCVESPVRHRRKIRHHQESGHELDPQAVLERRADWWTDVERVSVPKHVVTVGVNLAISSSRRPEDLIYRGAAAAAIADLLTQAGHSVEVVGFCASSHSAHGVNSMIMRVPLKRADAPLDMSSLCVAAAEIGFFRVVMIDCIGRVVPGEVCTGFGLPRTMTENERADVDVLIDSDVFSEESAVRVVRQAIADFKKEDDR